jgi:hypothetical protein
MAKQRFFVAGLAGAVPYAGPGLGGLVKLLWNDSTSTSLFDQMKDYVDALVPELISQEHVTKLAEDAKGFHVALNLYLDASDPLEKGQLLSGLVEVLASMQGEFFDPRAPEAVLDSFVQYGTIYISALRERYIHGTEYWPSEGEEARKSHLKELQDTTTLYSQAMLDIVQRAMTWRMSKVYIPAEHDECKWETPEHVKCSHWYTVADDFCQWNGNGYQGDADFAIVLVYSRRSAVLAAYASDLQSILRPADGWAALANQPARALSTIQFCTPTSPQQCINAEAGPIR